MQATITPLISVILSVYNAEPYLSLAIKSILEQTFVDFELIIVNDGSTDNSLAVATRYATLDKRIKIVSHKNKGFSASMNKVIPLARGKYIARMDADDISFPTRLQKQAIYLEEHPEIDIVGTRLVAFHDSGEIVGVLPFAPDHAAICARPWRGITLAHATWMIKKSWFMENMYKIPEVRRAEDQELLLRTYKKSQFASLDEVLYAYRQRPYQFHGTLVARKSMLKEQIQSFRQHHEWRNLLMAVIYTSLKIPIDFLASLPGCDILFFIRMSGRTSDSTKEMLSKYLGKA